MALEVHVTVRRIDKADSHVAKNFPQVNIVSGAGRADRVGARMIALKPAIFRTDRSADRG